ncbi:MAG: DNA polymerase [Pseudomonadota bacterium]
MFHSLYVDLNSFFASVEQQLDPALRGLPVGVLPVLAETTCCIAASIQAKRFGIKTGTPVWEARKRCKGIQFVQARPSVYVEMHHKIVEAVESCYPVAAVLSIDEMALDLTGRHTREEHALELARQIKRTIYERAGEVMHCSIGIAPNRFLAKTASNFKKPDGLELIRPHDLPHILYKLELTDLNGISRGMEKRLNRVGIHTVEQLCNAPPEKFRLAWGGIEGERYLAKLRGEALPPLPTQRSTVGHSHVLPPEMRNDESALAVLYRLLHKAAMRLRHYGYYAGAMGVHVRYQDGERFAEQTRFAPHADTFKFNHVLAGLWERRPRHAARPMKIGVVLSELTEQRCISRDLFEEDRQGEGLSLALDQINRRFGPNAVHFGAAH